jgi:hypothetical protein
MRKSDIFGHKWLGPLVVVGLLGSFFFALIALIAFFKFGGL